MSEKESVVFIDGKKTNEKCPDSDGGKCPVCGKDLEGGYGFAGGYGLGAYMYCEDHGIYDFCEDLGI